MAAEISFTLDLEDNRESGELESRFASAARRLLPFLAERDLRGTVFVVGELAATHADLVSAFADAGHEIGLHGHRHVPLVELDAAAFRAEVVRGKAALEDLTGLPVRGFRAPYFSLTSATPWVPEVLAEHGFAYSSSALPAASPLYGWAECPAAPFRWPGGLLELPVPVAGFGRHGLPFLGGVYLRLLPPPAVRAALSAFGRGQLLWTYCHPYDFDADEPFRVLPDLGSAKSRLLWHNRRRMLSRIDALLRDRPSRPLGERVAAGVEVHAAAPVP
jgi:polysaccharide deacetylase family protein (PEP-CTERM system associated)